MVMVCAAAALLAHPFITVIFGFNYAAAADITIALLPGVFFLSVASIASQFLSAFGIPWTQVAAWVVGLVVQVGLSIFLVGDYGVLGLAWAQSACSGVICTWLFVNTLNYRPEAFAGRTHHSGGEGGS